MAPATRRLTGAARQTARWPAVAAEDAGQAGFALRPFSAVSPRVLLIGASTGGPQALIKLMSASMKTRRSDRSICLHLHHSCRAPVAPARAGGGGWTASVLAGRAISRPAASTCRSRA
jgi:chemotaxis response regulator CheB